MSYCDVMIFRGAGGRSFQSRLDSRSQHRNQNEDQVECWDDVDTNTQFNNGKTGDYISFTFTLFSLMIKNNLTKLIYL